MRYGVAFRPERPAEEAVKNPCYCGWAYDGKKCRELQKKFPALKYPTWHHPLGEAPWGRRKP